MLSMSSQHSLCHLSTLHIISALNHISTFITLIVIIVCSTSSQRSLCHHNTLYLITTLCHHNTFNVFKILPMSSWHSLSSQHSPCHNSALSSYDSLSSHHFLCYSILHVIIALCHQIISVIALLCHHSILHVITALSVIT